MHVAQQLDWDLKLLGSLKELVLAQGDHVANLLLDLARMANGLNNVARARLALGPNYGSALCNAAKRLAQVARTAHKGNVELGFIDVAHVVCGGERLGLVDVVDFDCLQHLRLDNMANAAFGHHGEGDGFLDATDHGGVAHAAHATGRADVCRDALQRHDGARSGLFCDMRLLGGGDVHNDAAFKHLGKLAVKLHALCRSLVLGMVLPSFVPGDRGSRAVPDVLGRISLWDL